MAQLLVLAFDGVKAADEVLHKLRTMKAKHLVDLEDSVVAVRGADGRVQLKQALSLARIGAASGGLSGAFWGMLVGTLFLNPIMGAAIGASAGAGAGALSGSLIDHGINDDFVKKVAKSIPEGSSALFVLLREATLDTLVDEIKPWNPRILETNLSAEQQARLVDALAKQG